MAPLQSVCPPAGRPGWLSGLLEAPRVEDTDLLPWTAVKSGCQGRPDGPSWNRVCKLATTACPSWPHCAGPCPFSSLERSRMMIVPENHCFLCRAIVLGGNIRLCPENVNSVRLNGIICKKQMFGIRTYFWESGTIRGPWTALRSVHCVGGIWTGPRTTPECSGPWAPERSIRLTSVTFSKFYHVHAAREGRGG